MSLRTRLAWLGISAAALVAFSAAPAVASVDPLTITGTSGLVTVTNGVGGSTVIATPDPGPITFTAHFGLVLPIRVVGQETLQCVDKSGLHQYAASFASPYETGKYSSITWQPSQCPTGQTPWYHQVTAQAEETDQVFVIGQGLRTVTVLTGNVTFSWAFPQ